MGQCHVPNCAAALLPSSASARSSTLRSHDYAKRLADLSPKKQKAPPEGRAISFMWAFVGFIAGSTRRPRWAAGATKALSFGTRRVSACRAEPSRQTRCAMCIPLVPVRWCR